MLPLSFLRACMKALVDGDGSFALRGTPSRTVSPFRPGPLRTLFVMMYLRSLALLVYSVSDVVAVAIWPCSPASWAASKVGAWAHLRKGRLAPMPKPTVPPSETDCVAGNVGLEPPHTARR
jgi:hypothetical protein